MRGPGVTSMALSGANPEHGPVPTANGSKTTGPLPTSDCDQLPEPPSSEFVSSDSSAGNAITVRHHRRIQTPAPPRVHAVTSPCRLTSTTNYHRRTAAAVGMTNPFQNRGRFTDRAWFVPSGLVCPVRLGYLCARCLRTLACDAMCWPVPALLRRGRAWACGSRSCSEHQRELWRSVVWGPAPRPRPLRSPRRTLRP